MAGKGGGAWKVAYADFVTAMMAFFLVMWIVAQNKEVRQAVAHYFNDTKATGGKFRQNPSDKPNIEHNRGGGLKRGKRNLAAVPVTEVDPEGEIKSKRHNRYLVNGLGDDAVVGGVLTFADAAVDLTDAQRKRMRSVAAELAGKPHLVEIHGYVSTDPLPEDAPARDRWDLTYARCRRIAEWLEACKVERDRLRIVVSRQSGQLSTAAKTRTPSPDRVEVYMTDRVTDQQLAVEAQASAE